MPDSASPADPHPCAHPAPASTGTGENTWTARFADARRLGVRDLRDLAQVTAQHHRDGPLDLDVDDPAVRAVLALYVEIKTMEHPSGGWNGAALTDLVGAWLSRLGLDPDLLPELLPDWYTATGAGARDIDLGRVAELVRAAGVECTVEGPVVAVLTAAPATPGPEWSSPWAVIAGPGQYCVGEPCTVSLAELYVGPDGGQVPPTFARDVGARTEEQVAQLILAQTRIADPSAPLTRDELRAAGLDRHR